MHGQRLKLFRNSDFEVTQEIRDHLSYQAGELLVIDEFIDVRQRQGTFELQFKWRGYNDNETDWEAYSHLKEDEHELLETYIEEIARQATKRQRSIAA